MMITEGTQWLKVQKEYSKNISDCKVSKERTCQNSDLKVVESEEGKSEIYLPNHISRYSVTSENNHVCTFD